MTELISRAGTMEIGIGQKTVLINDQLRVMDQDPAVLEQLRNGNTDRLIEIAQTGYLLGIDMVDILLVHRDLDEVDLLPKVAKRVHEEIGCPISLDTRNPEALEAALETLKPYKCLVNSVSAEPEPIEQLLPLAAKYGAAVVAMPVGGVGIPDTVEGRIEQTVVIIDECQKVGIPKDDIIVDAICMASSALPGSMQITLETLKVLVEEYQLATILGIGNAGFGMPQQTVIDLAYLLAAIPWGLHSALVDPLTAGLVETVRAVDFLVARDEYGLRYLEWYRQQAKQS